jgi:hypothetical protein
MHRLSFALPGALAAFFLVSCQNTYYAAMEKLGYEKREILVNRVEEARDAQEKTKETFADALEEFSALLDFEGGDLERLYSRLQRKLADSRSAAEGVSARIEGIERVARDLFREWESELDAYSSDALRRQSAEQLRQTRDQADQLLATMRRAESKIPPVLTAFNDQVLFLKHNLNAQAIASLGREAVRIQSNVASLIAEMEAAIAEANSFIEAMR